VSRCFEMKRICAKRTIDGFFELVRILRASGRLSSAACVAFGFHCPVRLVRTGGFARIQRQAMTGSSDLSTMGVQNLMKRVSGLFRMKRRFLATFRLILILWLIVLGALGQSTSSFASSLGDLPARLRNGMVSQSAGVVPQNVLRRSQFRCLSTRCFAEDSNPTTSKVDSPQRCATSGAGYDGLVLLRFPRTAMATKPGVAAVGSGVELSEAGVPKVIYRQGTPSPSNLTPRASDAGNLSFRDSLSNPVGTGEAPVMNPGKDFIGIDTSKLPPGSVIYDNVPPGHVTVRGVTPEQLKNAVVDRGKFPK
jgi:hypothetical protein